MSMKRPNSRRNLDLAIERLVGRENFVAKRIVIANAIVCQMLPNGAVKGGSAIKMRLGDSPTRFTTDLDVARASSIEQFSNLMQDALAVGWEGFTGTLASKKQAQPANVPVAYLMQPFSVKLSFNSKPWLTVDLEVGFDEIGDADDPDFVVPEDADNMLAKLGFSSLDPVPVMALRHQISQKLHAVSEPGSHRAHDLIDLQLLDGVYDDDYSEIKETCKRLFAFRNLQKWPPVIKEGESWELLYKSQLNNSDLIQNVSEAVKWANDLIARIDSAGEDCG